MNIRSVPNLISGVRIIISVILLFTAPFTVPFYILYVMCGISDMLDGFLARRYNAESGFGATLDSVADLVFLAAMLYAFLPLINRNAYMLASVAAIAALRIASYFVGIKKRKSLVPRHTVPDKATGLALFGFPLWICFIDTDAVVYILCAVALFAAAHGLKTSFK